MTGFEAEVMSALAAVESDPFAQALADLDTRCAELAILVGRRELEHVPSVFRSVVDDWLDARAAYETLVSNEPPVSAQRETTLRRLEAVHAALHKLISLACMLSQRHATQSELEDICRILVTAAQPMDGAASTDL